MANVKVKTKWDTSSASGIGDILVLDNEVVETLFENQLITQLNLQQFATADYSLSETPGMTKRIRKYIGTGAYEELAMGEGNSDEFGSYFEDVTYEVGTTQGKAVWYDEQFMNDPDAINKMIEHMSEEMTNDMTTKIVNEFEKGSNKIYGFGWDFDGISDAIATFPKEQTENETLFLLINRVDATKFRKKLKDSLKYVEAFVRRGYVGTVCGVPIYTSDAVVKGHAYLGTSKAVTIFVKKGVGSESERDADHRKNTLYMRKVMLVALTDDDRIIVLTENDDPREGYVKVSAKPDDWASKYNTDYYFYDAIEETLELNTESDWDKVAGKIYEADA